MPRNRYRRENQYTRDAILYLSPDLKGPITELRMAGDRLVLYTEDTEVFRRFRQWTQLITAVPYHQEHLFDGKRTLVAVDLYFPKTARQQLVKALNDGRVGNRRKTGVK